MHILMCEPSVKAGLIAAMLRRGGHSVTEAETGADLVHLAKVLDHDVVLFDPSLPDMTGVALIRALRHGGVAGPVCLLSADSDAEMRIRSLEMGADDFIRSPINGKELTARLTALARRSAGHATPVARFGDLAVNLSSHEVSLAGRPVPLTVTEARIVELLALRRGRTVTKEAMISYLYALSDAPTAKTIDVFICKIRRKIADLGGNGCFVATIWGRGYLLQDPNGERKAA